MQVFGIVCEYNPFHSGHEYLIRALKNRAGEAGGVVCVMGGNFTQRGEPAVFHKHARAEAAVSCGADIVFELPLPWAVSSAEGFARGAVGILGSLGVVTHIGFGSECGETEPLIRIARALVDPEIEPGIKARIDAGMPYAAARQKALEEIVGETASLIEKPNNILAIEYLKALYLQKLRMEAVTVSRIGAGHNERGAGRFRSASELRALLISGKDISRCVPKAAAEVYKREIRRGRGPVYTAGIETAVISRLRMPGVVDFDGVPDATGGIGSRLCKAAAAEPSIDAILAAAGTKMYTTSRLRRMIICAALGIKKEMAGGMPPYARLLACSTAGFAILREIKEKSSIPIITKPARVLRCGDKIRDLFTLESAATDLYVLGFKETEERRSGRDRRTSPVITADL